MTCSAVPPGIDPGEVKSFLAALPGVAEIHDLEVRAISITDIALTAHLAVEAGLSVSAVLAKASEELSARFAIDCVTLEAEPLKGWR
jgi:cobalt-zinc-cadmium efflux system protein